MFPNSQIAKSYKQKTNKVKYTVQFGIEPWFRNIVLKELKTLPFSFRFDETTTAQIKKQYDAYATYHSRHVGQAMTAYLGTLSVFRCMLMMSSVISMNSLKSVTYVQTIILLGMDWPNVNLSFKRQKMILVRKIEAW